MAYTQTPGRGNHPKTGHGLPSPFKQMEIEVTKKYEEGKKKLAENRSNGIGYDGLSINNETGEAKPKLPMHSVVKAGSYVRELDSKGGVVREELMDSKGNKNFYKSVENRNSDVTNRQTRNAEHYNITGGAIKPEKMTDAQKKKLVGLGKAIGR